MASDYAHLHVHTEYSMLDGAARLKDLFAEVERLGMTAVAITDHGNMHGAYDFYKQATKAGHHPVLGDRGVRGAGVPVHQAAHQVGAAGAEGRRRLRRRLVHPQDHLGAEQRGPAQPVRLTSLRLVRGVLHQVAPDGHRADRRALRGIIATTGCPSGEVQTRLRLGQFDEALAAAAKYQDIFGKENYFLELMDHGLDIERRVRDGLVEIGRQLNLAPVVTNDSHYTYESQAAAHDVLLCVQTASNVSDPNRFRFGGSGYFIKSAERDARARLLGGLAAGLPNTLPIAEKVDTDGHVRLPQPDAAVPDPGGVHRGVVVPRGGLGGHGAPLPGRVRRDAPRRRPSTRWTSSCRWGSRRTSWWSPDFILWAKNNGIAVGPGRGSAAGSPGRVRDGHHRPGPDPARADLRAVPQPRAGLDARHRHRLRRASAR